MLLPELPAHPLSQTHDHATLLGVQISAGQRRPRFLRGGSHVRGGGCAVPFRGLAHNPVPPWGPLTLTISNGGAAGVARA
jgi:hypothetical protein